MKIKRNLIILLVLSLCLMTLYMCIGMDPSNFEYLLTERGTKLLAMIVVGFGIAFSSMIFQSITNNRILTPSVMGLDSLYMLMQTFIVFAFGSDQTGYISNNLNFIISTLGMLLFSIVLYKTVLQKQKGNIYFLLLVGIILGTLFRSFSSFMQMIIDPNEFSIIQGSMFASFNNVNSDLLLISIVSIVIITIFMSGHINILDALSLGRDQAINLGVSYEKTTRYFLIATSALVSVSTALVGPITFLGFMVVNVTHQILNTYKHKYLIIASTLISIITLVGGELLIEKLLKFSTPLSVVINLVGGIYFIYLLLKGKKA